MGGAYVMGAASQFWIAASLHDIGHRKALMIVQVMCYGIGHGLYLAGDLALSLKTLPDPNQASRFLGLWGLSAFIGGRLGSLTYSAEMELFGQDVPRAAGYTVRKGTYNLAGYSAI